MRDDGDGSSLRKVAILYLSVRVQVSRAADIVAIVTIVKETNTVRGVEPYLHA